MFSRHLSVVTAEIANVLNLLDDGQVEQFAQNVLRSRGVIVHGAGRVGLTCKGFAMRLAHLGKEAYCVSDANIRPAGSGDLLVIASSSGETQTVFDVADMGKHSGASVAVITASGDSRIARLADTLVVFTAPTKFGPKEGVESVQPMATLFEQCLQIFFDIMVLMLMEKTGQRPSDLWARHTNLD